VGGSGGGGNGALAPSGGGAGVGSPGTDGLGGGGGGGYFPAGRGGNGVVILAYSSSSGNIGTVTGNLVYSYSTARSGYKVYTFTSGTGTVLWP
jgi:hypothetical protein